MKTRESGRDERQAREGWPGMFWCASEAEVEETGGCCTGTTGMWYCSSMMDRCMSMYRWFALVALILGIALLLLGYYLDASLARILWMFIAGFVALMGVMGLVLGGRICRGARQGE